MFEFLKPRAKQEDEVQNDFLNIENSVFHTQAAVNTFKDNTDYQSLVYQEPTYDVPDYKAANMNNIGIVVDSSQIGFNQNTINPDVKIVQLSDNDEDGGLIELDSNEEILDFDYSDANNSNPSVNSSIFSVTPTVPSSVDTSISVGKEDQSNIEVVNGGSDSGDFDIIEDYVHTAEPPELPSIFASPYPPEMLQQNVDSPNIENIPNSQNAVESDVSSNMVGASSIFQSYTSSDSGLSSVSNVVTSSEDTDKLSLFGSKDGVTNVNSYSSTNQFEEEKLELQQAVEYTEDGFKICPKCGAILNPNAPVCFMCSKSFVLKK